MSRDYFKVYLFIFILLIFIFLPYLAVKAFSANYQPDLLIGYNTSVDYAGGAIYNLDGSNQTLYKILLNYEGAEFKLKIVNNGRYVDKLIITGSRSDNYWSIQYIDSVGTDITNQITGNGWLTASLPSGQAEDFLMRLTPKKTLIYGQESSFFVQAKSFYDSSKQDLVKIVLTVRFNSNQAEQNQKEQPSPSMPLPSLPPSSPPTQGVVSLSPASQPDLEIKLSADKDYFGRNIFDNQEAISTQIKTLSANSAFNPAILYFRINNNGKEKDNFLVKTSVDPQDGQINFFVLRANKWEKINEDINTGQTILLFPRETQEYKIEVNVSENFDNTTFIEIPIIAYSLKDSSKGDAVKFRINIDNDLDKDGLSDICEKKYKLDPRDPKDADLDLDGDSLSNKEECANGTDPRNKDTNSDGLWDGAHLDSLRMILPGLKSEHLIIAGPTKNSKFESLGQQTIKFVLTNPSGNKNEFSFSSDDSGMIVFQIRDDLLSEAGGYTLEATGNDKVFQAKEFFLGPYGKVYNKKTKKPLSGLRVNLESCRQTCCQYLASVQTSEDGSYNNFLLTNGFYRLVVNERGFKQYLSNFFSLLKEKEGNKYDIWLNYKPPGWLVALYWLLSALAVVVIFILISKIRNYSLIKEYQADGQIKLAEDNHYFGDTIYNLDSFGQTREKRIGEKERAIFHIRIQNDGRLPDKFLVTAPIPPKGWALKFFNVLEGGNEITRQITGSGWKTGNLASGLTKDIRLEVWVGEVDLIENNTCEIPITVRSLSDQSKCDVVKARVTIVEKSEESSDSNQNKF